MKIVLDENYIANIKVYFNLHPDTKINSNDVLKLAGKHRWPVCFEFFFAKLCLRKLEDEQP